MESLPGCLRLLKREVQRLSTSAQIREVWPDDFGRDTTKRTRVIMVDSLEKQG